MFLYSTSYHRASSVEEAGAMLSDAPDGKFVAGGQTLIATLKQRLAQPSDLIDLRHIPALKGIAVDGRTVTIGAGVTHAEVAGSGLIRSVCPAICHLASLIGDPHVRHLGTIGGSIANNDPAADYPAAVLGLGATIITDRRQIAADDFFVGLFETALEENEMVTAVRFTAPDKAGYAKFANPASRFAMAGVFVSKGAGGVRVAVTGAGSSGVFRHGDLEAALASDWSADALAGAVVDSGELMADMHATAEYRANLVKVMAKRAVSAC
ncbi:MULTISPECIES: FAD binding domain-containing protein [Alphaproteobacteria]|uniref:Carbon monoxide dehydrogenase n=2 Tax=Alphaproteobacteria TaxID=28211 RepID=A0A512HK21_9HYPH|nr:MULTISPECIES: xanthine dehydrogenase family protein subunit M [Alphaproteobacteria]GEO85784.1 carbon monoxide dehydrogenase [Ciceribacter naphthalenivorans]GLR21856.1 carbon monoxide dehydrogenase [Ciceribacter naphthalenivorans]GLT04712.1 carbon monoxide dehydrogenase [Sphingomonas psychrolutea]